MSDLTVTTPLSTVGIPAGGGTIPLLVSSTNTTNSTLQVNRITSRSSYSFQLNRDLSGPITIPAGKGMGVPITLIFPTYMLQPHSETIDIELYGGDFEQDSVRNQRLLGKFSIDINCHGALALAANSALQATQSGNKYTLSITTSNLFQHPQHAPDNHYGRIGNIHEVVVIKEIELALIKKVLNLDATITNPANTGTPVIRKFDTDELTIPKGWHFEYSGSMFDIEWLSSQLDSNTVIAKCTMTFSCAFKGNRGRFSIAYNFDITA